MLEVGHTFDCRDILGRSIGQVELIDRDGKNTVGVEPGTASSPVTVEEGRDYLLKYTGSLDSEISFAPPIKSVEFPDSSSLFGSLTCGTALGSIPLTICNSSGVLWKERIFVRPKKFSEHHDFERLLEDICNWRFGLLFDERRNVGTIWSLDGRGANLSPEERLIILRAVIEEFDVLKSIGVIKRNSIERLERTASPTPLGRDPHDALSFRNALAKPGNRVHVPTGHMLASRVSSLPANVLPARKSLSWDSSENQFVKLVLSEFLRVLDSSKKDFIPFPGTPLSKWIDETTTFLHRELRSNFFKSVSATHYLSVSSPSLQRRRGYRNMLDAHLAFRKRLLAEWDDLSRGLSVETRDVADLYEVWCFIRVLEATSKALGCEFDRSSLISEAGAVKLPRGSFSVSSNAVLIGEKSLGLTIYYNRTFSARPISDINGFLTYGPDIGAWGKNMRPDVTLAFYPFGLSEGAAARNGDLSLIHFDAKYRLQRNSDAEEGRHQADDIDKMHAYVSAIRYSRAAFALFPGDIDVLHMSNDRKRIAIGALGLSPSRNRSFSERLKQLVHTVLDL